MLIYEKRIKSDMKIDLTLETIEKVRQSSALGCESAAIAREELPKCFKLYPNLYD